MVFFHRFFISQNPDVPKLNFLVLGPREKIIAVYRVPFNLLYRVGVRLQLEQTLFGVVPRVPNQHGLVLTSSDNQRVKWMPIASGNLLSVLLEFTLHFRRSEIPNFGLRILGARNEFD